MPISLGNNIPSLVAQRKLGVATDAVSAASERLSSGLRINRASDDAAGLAIADSLAVKSRVFGQAIRNVNDGISLANVAEGALSSLTDVVTRQRELAEQAANGVYSSKQRSALNSEAAALTSEYNRILESTSFNGRKVFDPNAGAIVIQHGEGAQESTAMEIGSFLSTRTWDGTFAAQTTVSTGSLSPVDVSLGDFDGDGVLDVAYAGSDSAFYLMLGNGDGTFKGATSFDMGDGSHINELSIADLDGDGRQDMVVSTTQGVKVWTGNGNGSFSLRYSFAASGSSQSVSIADVDGDGVLDLVSVNYNNSTLDILHGRGGGTFSLLNSVSVGVQPAGSSIADLNGDGRLDIVSLDFGAGTATALLNDGNGSFHRSDLLSTGALPSSAVLADLNGDGIVDIVAGGSGARFLTVAFGRGDGTFVPQASYTVEGLGPQDLHAGDFNGDGVLDLVFVDLSSSAAEIALGNGDGTFRRGGTFAVGSVPYNLAIGDLDGNGVLDFVSADYGFGSGHTLSVLKGNSKKTLLVAPLDLTSQDKAKASLDKTAHLLELLSLEMGGIGASRSRFETTSATLKVRSENYLEARSRIIDADVAQESATLVRSRILQQAAAAVLAQANGIPALSLKLLGA